MVDVVTASSDVYASRGTAPPCVFRSAENRGRYPKLAACQKPGQSSSVIREGSVVDGDQSSYAYSRCRGPPDAPPRSSSSPTLLQ